MSKTFDLIVIGAGPGGYVAAIRAAQLGLATVCIDAWTGAKGGAAPGGTCTNVGCIPSKALLQSSEHFAHLAHHAAEHGIATGPVRMDVAKMLARKDAVVQQNNDGIAYLLKKNKVAFVHGRASFVEGGPAGWTVEVQGPESQTLRAQQVIVATGSQPRPLAGVPFDETRILSSAGALRLGVVPQRLGIVGAGAIGLEMASVWRRLGADVTLLEAQPEFLGAADEQIAREALKAYTKQGLRIELGVSIGSVASGRFGVTVNHAGSDGRARALNVDQLILNGIGAA